ncbi:putative histone-arginine methyltransferase 1.4, partial [Vitis vinifera]
MEVSLGHKRKQQEFSLVSISHLSPSSSSTSPSPPVVACFSAASLELRFQQDSDSSDVIKFDLQAAQVFKLSPVQSVCISEGSEAAKEVLLLDQKSYSRGIVIEFNNEEQSKAFYCAFEQWKKEAFVQGAVWNKNPCVRLGRLGDHAMESMGQSPVVDPEAQLPNGTVSTSKSKFDDKIEASSAKMYFHYYGQLLHQQNMLQDYVRTGTYFAAVIENRTDFTGRVVVDVGAGSGILSLFAAQAGAKHVYAVEASEMAEYARKLIAGNPSLGKRITVVKGKVEDVELPEKADILISEPMGKFIVPHFLSDKTFPQSSHHSQVWNLLGRGLPNYQSPNLNPTASMDFFLLSLNHATGQPFGLAIFLWLIGTLLVNERMLESYVIARDRFLIPD